MPKKTGTPRKALYRRKPPGRARGRKTAAHVAGPFPHAAPLATAPFVLREDGDIEPLAAATSPEPQPVLAAGQPSASFTPPRLIFRSDTPFIRLYHGNCLELLDAIAAKYPEGRFDAIFADPSYFLSNGGITCHAGRMVRVDKGDWDKSRGPELNHAFNLEWLRRCQRVLKPNGTLWVTGTLHVIFSIGYALQQLGFKLLNDIAWEKPNPPPNLSCRYFTHSTETLLWAAKNEKSKHTFNYAAMKAVTGKQMKTVWRKEEFVVPPSGGSGRLTPGATAEDAFGGTPNAARETGLPAGRRVRSPVSSRLCRVAPNHLGRLGPESPAGRIWAGPPERSNFQSAGSRVSQPAPLPPLPGLPMGNRRYLPAPSGARPAGSRWETCATLRRLPPDGGSIKMRPPGIERAGISTLPRARGMVRA